MKTALVTGVSGQDGFFMAQLLLSRGYRVVGLSRDASRAKLELAALACDRLELLPFDYTTTREIAHVINEFGPELIFNFAAKATGRGMFDDPGDLVRINGNFVLEILEAIRENPNANSIAFCQASSSEMFGDVNESPQNEWTALRPKSPYGAAKTYAHHLVGVYRSAYNLRASAAILYNHESLRRSRDFVTRKIAHGAVQVKLGAKDELVLGTLDACRDWGYAPEYVEAMFMMATSDVNTDFVVASGRLHSIRDLCQVAFGHLGLDYVDHVRVSAENQRRIDSVDLLGDPSSILERLGWRSRRTINEIIVEMVDFELATCKEIISSKAK